MSICTVCGGYALFGGQHECPPKWEVKVEDYFGPDDGLFVYADDAFEAAEKGLEKYDGGCGEGPTEEAKIHVRESPDGKWRLFKVTTEYTLSYHAEEVDEKQVLHRG